ncbi:MAG: lipid-A-disaccharide synthase [Firmicutes bacterium]|nr:lipid-A-disaccharide synthase [Bacillota bacterium]
MKVMISAGEASGDVYGAQLALEVEKLIPGVRLFGMGGDLMRKAGVRLLFNPTPMSTVGLVEALKSASVLRRVLLRLGDVIDRQRPDVIVLIDFPGFNMRLAELAKRKKIPVLYYFCPAAWAWGKGRAERIAETTTKVASVFAFEDEFYREAGADVTFVGHPLLDMVKPGMSEKEARRLFNLDTASPVFGILPGSREQEIRLLLPLMLRAAEAIKESVPEAQFVIPVAHTVSGDELQPYVANSSLSVSLVEGRLYDVLNVCELAMITSGTATLEAALLGVPHVAVYKVSAPTYLVMKRLIRIPYVSLPNIVAGKRVIPELLQHEATPDRLAALLLHLYQNGVERDAMSAELREIRGKLGSPGAVGRVAEMVVSLGAGQGLASTS